MVFFLGIKIAVILNQFPDPFFYLRPRQYKVGVGIGTMLFNSDPFTVIPCPALCPIGITVRTAAGAVLIFKKGNIGFLILMLLKLTVDTVLAIFKAASSYQDRVNIFLLNIKSRGFFVLCFCNLFDLFLYGRKIGYDFFFIGCA